MSSADVLKLADLVVLPYRVLGVCGLGPATSALCAAAILVVLAIASTVFTGELHSLATIPVLGLMIGIPVGMASFSWHRQALAGTIGAITPASTDTEGLDVLLTHAFQRFPGNWIIAMAGIAFGSAIYFVFPHKSPTSNIFCAFYGLLSAVGGILFCYGVTGFIWTYYLILRLSSVPFSLFYSHRLLALSTLACGLAFFGVWPIGFTATLWAIKPNILSAFVCVSEMILLLVGWALAEVGIHRINSSSKQAALDVIARDLNDLWKELRGERDEDRRKALYAAIEEAHKILVYIKGYRSGIVDWGALCGKVVIPIVIAATAASTAGIIKATMETQPKADAASNNIGKAKVMTKNVK